MSKYQKGTKTQLSTNFESIEFDCKGKDCCSETEIDPKLVEYLQKIRDYFGKPITINSAYRCEKHNKKIGGATKSKHRYGQAADIKISGIKPLKIAQYAEFIGIKGIGQYSNFVHIDTRDNKFFWYGNEQSPRSTFGGQNNFKEEEKQPSTTEEPQDDKVVITGSSVNVRKGPGTKFESLGTFKKGKEFDLVDTEEWFPIIVNNEVGWISKKYSAKQNI